MRAPNAGTAGSEPRGVKKTLIAYLFMILGAALVVGVFLVLLAL